MSDLDTQLIELLADGHFHSGEQLGEALGVSRMAVNKRIDKLTALGLDVFRVSGKGYRLAHQLDLLDHQLIEQELEDPNVPIFAKHITGSTNDDLRGLMETQELAPGTAVIAEMQTAGRGRRGKTWVSPFGSNLYVSIYWPLRHGLNAAVGMSVVVGHAIAKALSPFIEGKVAVKWPNDIYIDNQKVIGILVELEGQVSGEGSAIVGVGANLKMDSNFQGIDQPFTSLNQHAIKPLSRNEWSVLIIQAIRAGLEAHDNVGLSEALEDWPRYDLYYDKPVKILLGQHQYLGVGKGIDETGAFLVQQEDGLKRYFGGEISVRAQN
ncbi:MULTISPECIES: bifunctional biotin--[acetyl-CoA-carboxylase] ligase/biotin operon repressor BirA [Gammaproteobacteria]|uniref:bifunctional biotin--[acetyl-CoA-carboxylase] ligase/biotin operon repressor BirA n=1 Tax=Gammaproteobacteria TaxID=1236 RepID=UPI000DD0E050|nr:MULTISPECIES: bifunctional biotin--[acetyl-CoA-carboxylase] ligase/biotin operon repressor BirA [Gammaproteobacteria]RTE87755.1 bifunctional biotin--[acetyl-CoA-carboxylase] ligase/biotin operon repressor BirA [Aliidiomarina sp. B3213]TCZ92463.1 bifunctional biotin--[acetyl-CoA-carboxylase] ligase/biotin operon repressor BirA [Lysobacter sp. N42]